MSETQVGSGGPPGHFQDFGIYSEKDVSHQRIFNRRMTGPFLHLKRIILTAKLRMNWGDSRREEDKLGICCNDPGKRRCSHNGRRRGGRERSLGHFLDLFRRKCRPGFLSSWVGVVKKRLAFPHVATLHEWWTLPFSSWVVEIIFIQC